MNLKNMKIRLPMYLVGLFIMTIGIAISVKSNLGVSPVSSIPYTMTCIWGIEMGKATILFHIVLVLIQLIILRKNFKLISLLQIPIGVVFGYFTTFCNYLVSFFPTPDNIVIRIIMVLISAAIVAIGIFLYLPTDVIPLAGEGVMSAVSQVTKIEFSKVKMAFDITMVIISGVSCLIFIHNLGSVGIGTVIAAFLVGFILGIINKVFGKYRDKLLGKTKIADDTAETDDKPTYVISISREYGSGGRAIGKILAEKLGYKYYDTELIKLVMQESGYSPEYIEHNEQTLDKSALNDFFEWYQQNNGDTVSNINSLFKKEESVIKHLAKTENCVIVGRLANYILRNKKHIYNVFITADEESEIEKVKERDHLSHENAAKQVRKVNRERSAHCKYFTNTDWGNAKNYNLTIKSNDFGYEKTADLIEILFKQKFSL